MGADKLYVNGAIYTVDESAEWAQAVAVEGNRIVYVGDREGAEAFCGADTEICDLEGKMMLPGFIDGHCHPVMAAHVLSGVVFDIDWTLDECLAEVRKFVDEHPDNETYFGLGYAEWMFDEKGPKKELLDDICPDKPMFFMGSGGHEAWANSKCLEIAGVTKETPDPIPGLHYFARDDEGNPSGHIVEGRAESVILTAVNFFDGDSVVRIMEQNSADYAAMGVTGTADMGMFDYLEKQYYEALDAVRESGGYLQRFVGCTCHVEDPAVVDRRIDALVKSREKYDDDRFRMNFLKIINDGTMESRTAALSEPYPEDGSVIKPLMDEAQQAYQYFENDPALVNLRKKPTAPWGSDQLIKLYLEQLFICICRRDDNVRFSQRAITSTQFHQHLLLAQQARDYLAAHYSEAITLPSLAAALGISVSQLKRVFHEQIGQSMVRYLTALRIGEAKRLIREGNLTFTQIAERIGIESIYYFSNLFKKQTGMSPTEYEKTLKE